MKGMKALGVGFAVVGVLFLIPVASVALVLAVGDNDNTTAAATTRHMSNAGMASVGGGMMSSGAPAAQTTVASQKLTILHVQRGCHVWSDGTAQTPMLQLTMQRGQMLQVMNQDVDMHRMVELSGPMMMMLGGPMKTGQSQSLSFTKPGTYRFDTKSSVMTGMPEAPTTGPDNTLRLTVVVS